MKPIVSIRTALEDPNLLGLELSKPSWTSMRTLSIAAFGERLTDEERKIFTKLTGREHEPLQRVKREVTVAGRRSGKSLTAAAKAIYIGLLCDHSANLTVGEKGIVLVVAQNTDQAKVVFNYCVGILNSQPILRKEVVSITREAIVFRNNIEIQIRPASFRGLRGMTCVAAICDETAFWFTEENNSSNPDTEIVNAITPSLATTRGMLTIISSPYARRGVVWKLYSKHYGPNGDPLTLVAQGASRDFNSEIDQSEIDAALEEDFSAAQSEWLGQFRTDIESFVSMEAVQACVNSGTYEIAPELGTTYSCFIDASTGAGGDSFACAVGHLRETGGDVMIVDCIRNFKPKFSPEIVTAEISQLCQTYQVGIVYSDAFASGFVSELFNRNGLQHEFVKQNKSELYLNLLGSINARKIEMLDDRQCIQELINLERRVGFSGRDRIDHPPGCHDDSANCIAGLSAIVRQDLGSLNMALRMWGVLPTLAEEKRRKQEAERLAREAASTSTNNASAPSKESQPSSGESVSSSGESKSHQSPTPNTSPSPLDKKQSEQLKHQPPNDVRLLQL